MQYKSYTLRNFKELPQIRDLSEQEIFDIEVVGNVLPFKTNSYVVNELIDWQKGADDPVFRINFPRKGMLSYNQYMKMANLLMGDASSKQLTEAANRIRFRLNPHPAGQLEKNVPTLNGQPIEGVQHKYRETVLFFPGKGQTCHAYCTFCFRWPQFVGINDLRFSGSEVDGLIEYVRKHKDVTDILFTGGDPMVINSRALAGYIDKILNAKGLEHVRTIRFGTKSLSYWPYRFTTDDDAPELLDIFRRIRNSGRHVALMAHFNHPQELRTQALRDAVAAIKSTGAEIRTQSPLLKHINDDPNVWATMWKEQVSLGMIPYYMFMVRDTGAQHYFGVPVVRAWEIFREAYNQVSGVARTVRGPSMSADPGKVSITGVTEVNGKEVIVLQMLQGRNPDWALWPFFAEYDTKAMWLDELRPAFNGDLFFFEEEEAFMKNSQYFGY